MFSVVLQSSSNTTRTTERIKSGRDIKQTITKSATIRRWVDLEIFMFLMFLECYFAIIINKLSLIFMQR